VKAIGINDAVNTCDCCGKSGLKHTVIVLMDDGDIAHYGSVCATKNTGKSDKQIKTEIKESIAENKAKACEEFRSHACVKELDKKSQSKEASRLHGKDYQDFCEPWFTEVVLLQFEIAAKYGIAAYEVR
jgi:hypothetical protein